ncbi:MAG: hypothetical protein R3F54_30580 [Alphaproteobacteria bacterium]
MAETEFRLIDGAVMLHMEREVRTRRQAQATGLDIAERRDLAVLNQELAVDFDRGALVAQGGEAAKRECQRIIVDRRPGGDRQRLASAEHFLT